MKNSEKENKGDKAKAQVGHTALAGIKVLDLGQMFLGSYCGMLLGHMGAEVIKLESPTGENMRHRKDGQNIDSYAFNMLNLNKKGITLNLKHPKGKALFKDLVTHTDILIENFAKGVMEKMGMGYEVLREINPRLIYASGKGFGSTGPYSDYLAMDLSVQAMAGLISVTGFPDGPPTKCGPQVADFSGGVHLLAGVLAALYQREHTQRGQLVEISLHETVLPMLTSQFEGYYRTNGKSPERTGNRHGGLAACPYTVYEASDGYVTICCLNNEHWCRLCGVMGRRDLADNKKYLSGLNRAADMDFIDGEVNKWTRTKARFEINDILNAVHVPSAPVMTLAEVLNDPHHMERGMLKEIEHPQKGRFRVYMSPVHLSESKTPDPIYAPLLGQDNEEVFQELLGIDSDEIKKLKEENII